MYTSKKSHYTPIGSKKNPGQLLLKTPCIKGRRATLKDTKIGPCNRQTLECIMCFWGDVIRNSEEESPLIPEYFQRGI
ncbi:unnamed protein product [Allacma fusca]|uniref:Uncharacterized protein n=1 Tax=Allacma fusca TaxID=39272 RepID=A0A8J2PG22_9HEXA|nr:unnamed protein product [Allacma fusca]